MQYFKDKYRSAILLISAVVAFLIHFPELMMLSDGTGVGLLFPGMEWGDVMNEILFTFLSLLLLFALNYRFIFSSVSRFRSDWSRVCCSFILTWLINSILAKGFVFLHHQVDIPAINAMIHHYLHPLRDFILTFIVTGTCFTEMLIRRKQSMEVENQQLRAENLLNQYEALKNQLNPHMLFNSLNTLRSLIRETPDKAQEYLQELSHVLRYMLQGNESQSVSVAEEMDFVRAYMFLLEMRYEKNLIFDITIDEKAMTKQVPPMAVQLLLENAVKHNEISNRHPLTIRVCADEYRIFVENKLQPKLTRTAGTRIGLANLTHRYRLLFKEEIDIHEDKETFHVSLPLM
ncbi:MAG: sensor histidine kinase [Bacteroidales bacterium]